MHFAEYTCSFTPESKPHHTPSPDPLPHSNKVSSMDNTTLSQAQFTSVDYPQTWYPNMTSNHAVGNLVTRFSSLDMNPTPEDAYDNAVARKYAEDEQALNTAGSITTTATLTVRKHTSSSHALPPEFVQLVSRFHQAVRPPPSTPLCHQGHDQVSDLATSALGLTISSPHSNLSKHSVPSLFTEMKSLLYQAEEVMSYIRNDAEEVMKKARRRDRARRESEREGSAQPSADHRRNAARSDGMVVDDSSVTLPTFERDVGEPRLRKVPIARRSTPELSAVWFSPPARPTRLQDQNISPLMLSCNRRIITPKRVKNLQARSSMSGNTIFCPDPRSPRSSLSSAELTIESCSSQLTQLSLTDQPRDHSQTEMASSPSSVSSFPLATPPNHHATLHEVSSPAIEATSPTLSSPMSRPLEYENPIRFYAGYNHSHRHRHFSFTATSETGNLKLSDLFA